MERGRGALFSPYQLAGAALLAAAVLFLDGSTGAIRAGDPVDRTLQCLEREYGSMEAFTVHYEREIMTSSMALLGGGSAGDHASGMIHFQPPRGFKIKQETPEEEIMVTDGEALWWYIPRKQEAHRYSSRQIGRELQVLGDIFHGSIDLPETFEVVWEGHNEKGDDVLRLIPDPSWTQTDHIRMAVTQGCRIRVVEIHDRAGGLTRFTLDRLQPRPGFDKGFFTFDVPEGVRVVDETPPPEDEENRPGGGP